MDKLKIIAYQVHEQFAPPAIIVPGEQSRTWMDKTPEKFAYRCLPLTIANQHGWAIFPKKKIRCSWNGNIDNDSIEITDAGGLATSIFGNGILTFHIHYLIKTPPGYNLYITGAPNHFIANVWPLTGIYEADWAPYSFTMNWRILRPGSVEFLPSDPICFFFPVQRRSIENFELEHKMLSDNLEMKEQFDIFHNSRSEFNSNTEIKIQSGGWQKNYFQGKYPDGNKCPVDHQTKIKIRGSINDQKE